MKKVILDSKSIASINGATLANFVHDYTKRGYEPLPLQCSMQYGQIVITMVLYDQTVVDDAEVVASEVKIQESSETEVPKTKTRTAKPKKAEAETEV